MVLLKVHLGIKGAFLFASQLSGCFGSVCRGTSCVRAVSSPRQVSRCACWKLLMAAGEEIAEEVAVCGLSGDVMLGEWGTTPSQLWELAVTELGMWKRFSLIIITSSFFFLYYGILGSL